MSRTPKGTKSAAGGLKQKTRKPEVEARGDAEVRTEISRAGLEAAGVPKDAGLRALAADAALGLFHPVTAQWFRAVFEGPTAPQMEGWPAIARGESTLILAPTGTGKTLTAFLWCLDKLMLRTPPRRRRGAGCCTSRR